MSSIIPGQAPQQADSKEAIPLPAPDANAAQPLPDAAEPQQQIEQPKPMLMITTSEQNHTLLASPPNRDKSPSAASSNAAAAAGGLSAAIAGATGAVGRELVRMLVDDPAFTRVVALSRTPIEPLEWPTLFPGIDLSKAHGKLFTCPVDWEAVAKVVMPQRKRELRDDSISSDDGDDDIIPRIAAAHAPAQAPVVEGAYDASLLAGHTHAANCMGTTFASAKSVAKLRRVDHDYAIVFMELLRRHSGASNVHFSQVSYNGAAANSLLPYQRIKGKTDNVVRQANFRQFTIVKPGMLGRKEKQRFSERLLEFFLVSKIPVEKVAAGIIAEWRGLWTAPEGAHHKLHNKQIHESAGHYETRRAHDEAPIPAAKPARGGVPSPPPSPSASRTMAVPPNSPTTALEGNEPAHHGHHLRHIPRHLHRPHHHQHPHQQPQQPHGHGHDTKDPQRRADQAVGMPEGTLPVHFHG